MGPFSTKSGRRSVSPSTTTPVTSRPSQDVPHFQPANAIPRTKTPVFVMEQKCTRHPVPFCDVVWEKQCSNVPVCSTVFEKACHTVEKDVCVTHFQKACQTTTVNECRHEVVTEPQRWRRSLHEKFAAKKAEKLA